MIAVAYSISLLIRTALLSYSDIGLVSLSTLYFVICHNCFEITVGNGEFDNVNS